MRIGSGLLVTLWLGAACAGRPTSGTLGDGMSGTPTIVAVDSHLPPRSLTVQLDHSAFVAVIVVAPGHSATLLYPADSATDNRLAAGSTTLDIRIPSTLVRNDSAILVRRRQQQAAEDELLRERARRRSRSGTALGPLPANTPTYLLLLTSAQHLSYDRIIEKTAGVSIPAVDTEALRAVGKAVRSTLSDEPRTIAGYYLLVELNPIR